MNCTFPALIGPTLGGNAAAAIYKRVPRGSALEALGLAAYATCPFEKEQLARLAETLEAIETTQPSVTGGRSAERRDGKECDRKCSARRNPHPKQKKTKK